jgi:hypothetical protein
MDRSEITSVPMILLYRVLTIFPPLASPRSVRQLGGIRPRLQEGRQQGPQADVVEGHEVSIARQSTLRKRALPRPRRNGEWETLRKPGRIFTYPSIHLL